MQDIVSEYQKQGEKFLADTKTTFKTEFLYHGAHFPDDKDTRDVYMVTFERADKKWSFKFGQSIAKSGDAKGSRVRECPRSCPCAYSMMCHNPQHTRRRTAPTAYDVLACTQKYDTGTHENFCADFGYDVDSRKGLETYLAVQEEWDNTRKMFGDVIDALQEIQ